MIAKALSWASRWPHSTAFGVAGVVGGGGDAIAQHLDATDGDTSTVRLDRIGSMACFNAAFACCVYVPFYRALDRWFGAATTVRSVAQKTFMDQFVMVPAGELPCFFAFTGEMYPLMTT